MTKSELRKIYKARRQALSDSDIKKMSESIFSTFKSNFNFEGKEISIFLPIERLNEINTWLFLNEYPAQYYLPVIEEAGLVHVKFESLSQLKRTDWGILEPKSGVEVEPSLFDVVIVPLLAYDTEGNRVGYGKGYYDSFLKDCKDDCQFIGISFFEAEQDQIDTIPSDIRLHYCITPNEIHNFKNTDIKT